MAVTGTGFDGTVKVSLTSARSFTIVVKVTQMAALGARSITLSSTRTKGTSTLLNPLTVVS